MNSITYVNALFQKHVITGWCRSEACSLTSPRRKAWVESVAGLKHFPLHILWEKLVWRLGLVWYIFLYKSFKKSLFGSWSWFEAFSVTNPLRTARLDVVFSSHPSSIYSITYLINAITSVHASFQEHVITGWCLSGACSFTNSQRKSCVETVAGFRQSPLQVLWERLVWRLELVWCTFLYKSLRKARL